MNISPAAIKQMAVSERYRLIKWRSDLQQKLNKKAG